MGGPPHPQPLPLVWLQVDKVLMAQQWGAGVGVGAWGGPGGALMTLSPELHWWPHAMLSQAKLTSMKVLC